MFNKLTLSSFLIMASMANSAQAENAPLPTHDSQHACIENTMLLSDAQSFLENAAKNQPQNNKILISFGYTSSYVSPQEAITLYTQRTKHLTRVSRILGCPTLNKPSLTKTAWKQ